MKESIKKLVEQSLANARVDIDVEYCKRHGIKFRNDSTVECKELEFDSGKVKQVFQFLTK